MAARVGTDTCSIHGQARMLLLEFCTLCAVLKLCSRRKPEQTSCAGGGFLTYGVLRAMLARTHVSVRGSQCLKSGSTRGWPSLGILCDSLRDLYFWECRRLTTHKGIFQYVSYNLLWSTRRCKCRTNLFYKGRVLWSDTPAPLRPIEWVVSTSCR